MPLGWRGFNKGIDFDILLGFWIVVADHTLLLSAALAWEDMK